MGERGINPLLNWHETPRMSRVIINPYVFIPPLLDVVGTAAAGAWSSARRMSSSYSGALIRVRRSSDDTEDDVPQLNGLLDVGFLATFCSGTDGFITVVYDQSGNALNLAPASAALQPQIVATGVVITGALGHPCLRFDGVDDQLTVSHSAALPITWLVVVKSRAFTDDNVIVNCGGNARCALRQETTGSVQRYKIHSGASLGAIDIVTDAWNLVRAHFNSSGVADDSVALNAGTPTSGSAGDNAATSFAMGHPTLCAAADVHEYVIWEAALGAADEEVARGNMMQFYGIA